jgi:phosphatidylserine/phosphatidylglycerophosphate/cardiolipin synthase-like enzyme
MTPFSRNGRSRDARWSLAATFVLIVTASVLILYVLGVLDRRLTSESRAPQSIETPALAGFAQGPVQVYFTRTLDPGRTEGRGGGLDETIAADIERARQSIDLAAFDFDLPVVTSALVRAQERGLRVRVAIDGENLATPAVAAVAGRLQDAGVLLTVDRRPAFMHHKFLVVDGSVVWTGSWNPTANDTFRNNNNMVRLADTHIAALYAARFERLFGVSGAVISDSSIERDGFRITASFTPEDNITGDVVETIEDARSSVEFLMFSFTSDAIADALVAARRRGVRVRGVVESRNARGSGAEQDKLRDAGLDVLPDGNCFIMHHKVLIVDGQRVMTGSFNWSANAQEQNDENVIMVENGWLARRFQEEFERIYDQARTPMRCNN